MSAAVSMTLPGGRVVLGWWRALASLEPRRLWFAHLVLHRVEALVEVTSIPPLAALARSLLTQLARPGQTATLPDLATSLSLDAGLARLLVRDLATQGLVGLRPDDQGVELTTA